jgi:hypothetical protein
MLTVFDYCIGRTLSSPETGNELGMVRSIVEGHGELELVYASSGR